mmetsp:Transcript_1913/g.2941  ORF Transcript_1913/g.2941 Transcript_1913/m.2941 type:complete len:99 (-) Transcript_1913:72-368(-)|eukprot:CAMPEP_0201522278 /NCGR_PEP_ID=MMETSP0161_2-20130828/16723_1 /ASSEMBLY_ACC=CAM_ASM_000251 /TAXON_ID=180227 /ORGANISM="Neoparamoeba aestuarina, Strain SoJaBio B1-5/56/2" /LENGTH=98 /DNA_ID=CAMNT_0047921069 /DNA_START=142 /DNA_END=438 /DNA_ORIENTATION=+
MAQYNVQRSLQALENDMQYARAKMNEAQRMANSNTLTASAVGVLVGGRAGGLLGVGVQWWQQGKIDQGNAAINRMYQEQKSAIQSKRWSSVKPCYRIQ